jgi:excisionase family DNA binding protein
VAGPYLPLTAAAEHVALCTRTLRRAVSAGELPAYKVGSVLRFDQGELDTWMRSKAVPNARSTRGR